MGANVKTMSEWNSPKTVYQVSAQNWLPKEHDIEEAWRNFQNKET